MVVEMTPEMLSWNWRGQPWGQHYLHSLTEEQTLKESGYSQRSRWYPRKNRHQQRMPRDVGKGVEHEKKILPDESKANQFHIFVSLPTTTLHISDGADVNHFCAFGAKNAGWYVVVLLILIPERMSSANTGDSTQNSWMLSIFRFVRQVSQSIMPGLTLSCWYSARMLQITFNFSLNCIYLWLEEVDIGICTGTLAVTLWNLSASLTWVFGEPEKGRKTGRS